MRVPSVQVLMRAKVRGIFSLAYSQIPFPNFDLWAIAYFHTT